MSKTRTRRAERKPRTSGGITQPPWKPLHYKRPPFALLSEDEVESIHNTGLRILQDVGMVVLSSNARKRYKDFGFDVDEDSQRVRFDPQGLRH